MKIVSKIKSLFIRLIVAIFDLIKKLFYVLGFLLFVRLLFKFAGANPEAVIVDLFYKWSDFFVSPFNSIFENVYWPKDNLIETSTLIAMIGYGLVFLIFYKATESFCRKNI